MASEHEGLLDGFIPIDQAATELNVSIRTIYKYFEEGLQYIKIGGRTYTTADWVREFLKSRVRQKNQPKRGRRAA